MTRGKEPPYKARVIFAQNNHPLHTRGRIMGRALTLLVKEASVHMTTLEMHDIRHIKPFVQQYNGSLINVLDHVVPKADPGEFRLFELDIVQMFPSLNRTKVCGAFHAVYDIVAEAKKARGKCGLWFAIHKYDTTMDRFGKGPWDQYTNVCYRDLVGHVT